MSEEVTVGPATYTINIDDETMFKWAIGSLLSDGGAKVPPVHSFVGIPANESEYPNCVTVEAPALLPKWKDVQDTIEILKDKERRNWIQGQAWRHRTDEYPSWEEQLDFMFHNGFHAWKKLIKDIKDKYPSEADAVEENWNVVRFERDCLLSECDWTQGSDVPDSIKLNWQSYRQSLRDITNQSDPLNVTWPTKPGQPFWDR